MDFDKLEEHWENVHSKKKENEVSWYQILPHKSIEIIKSLNLNLDSNIIDIGAGESRLVDNLLNMGFKNIAHVHGGFDALKKEGIKTIEKLKK